MTSFVIQLVIPGVAGTLVLAAVGAAAFRRWRLKEDGAFVSSGYLRNLKAAQSQDETR